MIAYNSFHIKIYNLAGFTLGADTFFDIPLKMDARYNQIKLKYISINAAFKNSASLQSLGITATLKGIVPSSKNIKIQPIIFNGMSGAQAVTENDGIVLITSQNGAYYKGEPIEINSDMIVRVRPMASGIAFGDQLYFTLTLGYNV